jgi:ABC-type transport system involved in cytochrome c biogenesis permease subunit
MRRATFWAPVAAAAFGVAWCGYALRPAGDRAGEMQVVKFGAFPVLDGGRVKPVDSFARVRLMNITRRQEYYWEVLGKGRDEKGRPKVAQTSRRPAVQWFLNLQAEGYAAALPRMPFVVGDQELREWLGLPHDRPGHQFSPRDLGENPKALERLKELEGKRGKPDAASPVERKATAFLRELQERGRRGDAILEARRESNHASFAAKIFRIDNDQLKAMLGLELREGHRYSLEEILTGGAPEGEQGRADHGRRFKEFLEKAGTISQQLASGQRTEKDLDLVETKVLELDRHLRAQAQLRQLDGLLLVPPGGSVTEWKALGEALADGDPAANPNAAALGKMVRAYAEDNVKAFNAEVGAFAESIAAQMPADARKARVESWFNRFAPFYQASLMYLAVLALAVASWLAPGRAGREALRRSALALACVAVVVHTLGLGVRVYLTERPPVTNLYSASVFIGWACVLLCLLLERTFRNGIAVTGAAALGFATMVVAHHLGASGDTLEVLQAVLDTNFWLATHVTTMTLGYSATFVAGLFGAAFVYLTLASAVREAFADRRPLSAAERRRFVASVFGLALLPALLASGLLGAAWVLLADRESLDPPTLLVASLPIFAAACVYAGVVVARRYSPEFVEGLGGELPAAVNVVDRLALTPPVGKALGSALYGVVCFATLLSFVGTVLGGIWADQSWGRFWGWDPKENGALMIVVMNALILHARWGGMIKERGMSILAVLGGMITVWSYFGTNQLGVGLHAYGFNNTLALGCAVFWLSQLAVVALGLLTRDCRTA